MFTSLLETHSYPELGYHTCLLVFSPSLLSPHLLLVPSPPSAYQQALALSLLIFSTFALFQANSFNSMVFFYRHSDGSQEETTDSGDNSQTLLWAPEALSPQPILHLHSDVQWWYLNLNKAKTSTVKYTLLPKPSPPLCSSSWSGSTLDSWLISFLHFLPLIACNSFLVLPSFHCCNTSQTVASLTCAEDTSS